MCNVLIVEDNDAFRGIVKEVFHSHFPMMNIEEEVNGSRLFSRMDVFRPNIVFMDIRLPGENGLELTKKLKMIYPDVTVVILTSYDLPEYRHAAIQSKADHFVSKDSPTSDLLALVKSICHDSKRKKIEPRDQNKTHP